MKAFRQKNFSQSLLTSALTAFLKNNCQSEEDSRKPGELPPSACRFLSVGDKCWDSRTSAC